MKYERKRAQRRDIAIVFIIVMLFCLRHLDVVLSTPTNMPITALIYQTTGSKGAGVILTVMLGVVSSTAQIAVTSASRLLYTTARDKGMPFLTWYVEFPRLPRGWRPELTASPLTFPIASLRSDQVSTCPPAQSLPASSSMSALVYCLWGYR
jgi:hypothetical protein